jgi:hypothetical protein
MADSLTYSNARNVATFDDWPHGTKRTQATFRVEKAGQGQRVARVTINPKTGAPSKPKVTTSGRRAAIVDGSDGRTYVATLTTYGHLSIAQSNLDYSQEAIYETDPRYAELRDAILALPQD